MSKIDTELVMLYEKFHTIGTITASITSLDGSGTEIIVLRATNYGSSEGESYSLDRKKFFEVYQLAKHGCFNLYEMKKEYLDKAAKYVECLKILDS